MRRFAAWPSRKRDRRQWALAWSLVALAVSAYGLARCAAADDPPGLGAVPPLVPYRIRIHPGIYLLGGLQPGAAYAVETPMGLVLVDTGLASDASLLKAQLTALGLDWNRALRHPAHARPPGSQRGRRAPGSRDGAKVYAGRGDADCPQGRRTARGPHQRLRPARRRSPSNQGQRRARRRRSPRLRRRLLRALAAPGHTPGSTCYLLERDGLRVLFTGDVISMLVGDEASRVKIQKPLGTYSAYSAPRYRGDARAYLASLRQLRAIPVPDLMLPGHPRSDPSPQDPRVGRERWEALLDGGIADMATLVARYEADGADFLDGIPEATAAGPLLPGRSRRHRGLCILRVVEVVPGQRPRRAGPARIREESPPPTGARAGPRRPPCC